MSRQKKLLSILLGLFGLTLTYGIVTYPRRERVENAPPQAVTRPEVAEPKSEASLEEGGPLPMEEEDSVAAVEPEVKRNIFEPLFPLEIPAVPPVPAPVENIPPPEIVPPPPPPFELLGYLQKEQDQIIFLTRANDLFIVRPGESFGENNRYRIAEAGPDKIVLEEEGEETTSLPFTDQESESEMGGQPFSALPVPPQGTDLSLPEPPSDYETVPEEPEESPGGPEGEEDIPEEAAPRSPLAPGLIGPEDDFINDNENIFEEDAAPSMGEVPNE